MNNSLRLWHGPHSKRSKPSEPYEIARRAGRSCMALLIFFPPRQVLVMFRAALGSPQEDDEDDEEPEATAARRSPAAANTAHTIFNDPVYVESCAQKMIAALPASAQKLRMKRWFYREVRGHSHTHIHLTWAAVQACARQARSGFADNEQDQGEARPDIRFGHRKLSDIT